MKKIIRLLLVAFLVLEPLPVNRPAMAEETEFKDTATGKAAKELLESLSNFTSDVAALKSMTLQQQLEYVRTKGRERIWAKTKEKSWDKVKNVITDYAKERMRSDYFKSKVEWMMHQCVVEKKAVSAVWNDVDAEISSKISTNLNALSKALDGLEVLKGAYDAWSEKGAEDGIKALGAGVADKIFEYTIPGWGYYRLAQALVEALVNYIAAYAFDSALQAKLEAILPFDPKKNSAAFADWILNVNDVGAFVNREWEEQIGYTGAYAKYDGKGETKDEFGDAMKNKIIETLTRLKSEVMEKKRLENELKSQIQAQEAKERASAQAAKSVMDAALKEANQYLSKIDDFEKKFFGLQKQDVQTQMVRVEKDLAGMKTKDSEQKYHYSPLDRATVISALEAAYAEVTETFSQGYDFDKLNDGLANYADAKDGVLKANQQQFSTITEEMNKKSQEYNTWFINMEAQINGASDEQTKRQLIDRKMAKIDEANATLAVYANALQVMSEERGKDMTLLAQAEEIVRLDVEARNQKMVDTLDQELGALQADLDKAYERYQKDEGALFGEVSELHYQYPYISSNLPRRESLPAAMRYPEEFFETLAYVRDAKDKLTVDSQKAPALYAKRKSVFEDYAAAVVAARGRFETIVPEKFRQTIDQGWAQIWKIKFPDIDYSNGRRAKGAGAGRAAIRFIKNRDQVVAMENIEAARQQYKDEQTLDYSKAIQSVSGLLSEYEAIEPLAQMARIFSQKIDSVFQTLLPYQKDALDRVNIDLLLTTRDGKAEPGLAPEESDAAKFVAEIKAAWDKTKGEIEALKKLRERYKKAAGKFRFQYTDPVEGYPFFDELTQIPDRITVFETALKNASVRQKWLLENVPKEIEKWRGEIKTLMALQGDYADRFAKLKQIESVLISQKAEIERYKARPGFSAIAENLTRLGNELKTAIEKTDDILTGKIPPPVPPGNTPAGGKKQPANDSDSLGEYEIFNPRINTYSLDSASGDVTLTKSQLMQGTFDLSGKLSHMDHVSAMLISTDGGRTWNEIPKSQTITYTFIPIPDKRYEIVLRVKTDDFRDIDLKFFPYVNSVSFKNVDTTQLILTVVKDLADAYESMNIGRFGELVSRDFLGDRTSLLEGVRFDFDMFVNIRLDIFINRIENRGDQFIVETKWDKSQTPRLTSNEQRTSGKTTMTFVLEDGKMKLQNLRGNLIYATLSPYIAETSGLSQKVIDEIEVAHNDRLPVQPGAGQTLSSGGGDTALGNPIAVKNGSLQDGRSYDFATGTEVIGVGSNDMSNVALNIHFNGTEYQIATGNFSSISTAPAGGYTTGGSVAATNGLVIIFKTASGKYGKMKVTSVGGGLMMFNFEYALQTDGSTNIRTV